MSDTTDHDGCLLAGDALRNKADIPVPEIGAVALADWLNGEIRQHQRKADTHTTIADRLASLLAGICSAGKWTPVGDVDLVKGKEYVIRRPGNRANIIGIAGNGILELAEWNTYGWRTIVGFTPRGDKLEVWVPFKQDDEAFHIAYGLHTPACAVKSSNGQHCPEAPEYVVRIDGGEEIMLCGQCYVNASKGAYGDVSVIQVRKIPPAPADVPSSLADIEREDGEPEFRLKAL